MPEQKKSRKSGSSKSALRIILALLPLPFALSLVFFPDLGKFSLIPIVLVFALGVLIGTFTHIYWLRTLIKEREFYKKFYDESVMKPAKNDMKLYKKHTQIVMPFYILGALMFVLVVFVLGFAKLEFSYALPLVFGAMEGIPISVFLMRKGVVS